VTVATLPADPTAAAREAAELAILERQEGLLAELAEVLVRQRGAVARDHAGDVNASADDAQRLLAALDESRHRAAELGAPASGSAALDAARDRVRAAARTASREAGINGELLRRSLAAGQEFLQHLFSTLHGERSGYGPSETRPATPGWIVDRRG
jgi:hypothetical protein